MLNKLNTKTLLSTAIAYANGAPHIGHAFEFVMADTLARYWKLQSDTYFITGMDEHGQKIQEKAQENNLSVQSFVDVYAEAFKTLDRDLSIGYNFFVRTSDKEKHYVGAQYLWSQLVKKGDLEKRTYKALYCVGCEEFKTEKDLNEQGECPSHLKKPEVVEEENYFFALHKYVAQIKEAIVSGDMEIVPVSRKNEILALLERGLEDVSFSRPVHKVSWGIPVPGDDTQVMYVWCDALSNYITAIGYGTDAFDEERWNNAMHVIGKDILRFHAAIWPGMLLSAGLPLPKKIFVHGHITSGGQKMSKSLGNVIDPRELIDLFTPACQELAGEALRFTLLHEVPSFEDGDLTMDSIKAVYTAHLANGIGNLTNRILRMSINYGVQVTPESAKNLVPFIENELRDGDVKRFTNTLFSKFASLDKEIQDTKPFELYKTEPEKAKDIVIGLLVKLKIYAEELVLIMPVTSLKILDCINENKMPEKPLFGRLP